MQRVHSIHTSNCLCFWSLQRWTMNVNVWNCKQWYCTQFYSFGSTVELNPVQALASAYREPCIRLPISLTVNGKSWYCYYIMQGSHLYRVLQIACAFYCSINCNCFKN
jgi:hypothetical protein